MPYGLLADLLVVVHLAFVLFVVAGALLVVRWRALIWVHVPCVLWGALIEFGGWVCPLTPLENHWRVLGGQAGYAGGFVEHYLLPVLYPPSLTRGVQVVLGVIVLTINVAAYRRWLRTAAAARRGPDP
jgi:hypothetical protein